MNLFKVIIEKDLEECWVLGPKQLAPRLHPSHHLKGKVVIHSCYSPCCLDQMVSRNIQQPFKKIGIIQYAVQYILNMVVNSEYRFN